MHITKISNLGFRIEFMKSDGNYGEEFVDIEDKPKLEAYKNKIRKHIDNLQEILRKLNGVG